VVFVITSSLECSRTAPHELWLPASERARLAAAAVAAYPREACGLLIGRVGVRAVEIVEVVVAANAAEAPHRAFVVPAPAWFAATASATARGLSVVGVWHAHPDGAAVPSAADAVAAWNDQACVIVAVTRTEAGALRAYWRRHGALREQTVCIEGDRA
jgi:proteasome lid subunit RPN8/RPN11